MREVGTKVQNMLQAVVLMLLAGYVTMTKGALKYPKLNADEKYIYEHRDSVDEAPEFPGGNQELIKYLKTHKNVMPPDIEFEPMFTVARVLVGFVVEQDGSLSNFRVVRGIDYMVDRLAIRVVQDMPKWKPAMIGGRPVRFRVLLFVTFDTR